MNRKIIDLTQTMMEGMPDWHGCCGFEMRTVVEYSKGLCAQEIRMPNGIGTHIDAPSHFIKGGLDISEISLEKLICPAVVINVSKKATAHYALTENDIIEFEKQYGVIPSGSIVMAYTGWCQYWKTPKLYRNAGSDGIMYFPKFSIEAVEYLLKRNINGIAIDTLSPDGPDYNFPVHHAMLGANKFIVENVNMPDELPAVGFTLFVMPIKIKFATEAPCRVVAIIDA